MTYHIGIDFAAKLKWWQRMLVFFGFRNKWVDKSCMVTYKRHENGTYELIDCNYFDLPNPKAAEPL